MQDADSILTSIFGLESFRLQQREIVNDVLAGRDALVVMPTGAGKSLCYQLPAVALRGLTLIVSPLISLMTDQVRQLRTLRIPALMLCSGQSRDEQREVMAKLRDGFRGLFYVAPERFSAPGFFSIIAGRKLSLLAIDEAHCISQWGHDFRPEYLRLGEVRKQLGEPLTIALTATATPEVRADIVRNLALNQPAIHVTGFDRPNLSYQSIVFAKAKNKDAELIDYLSRRKSGGIVYCSTRKNVEQISALLEERLRGRTVVAYHAGMEQEARGSNQQRFIDREDAIVVATNAFGMGINKPNLRWVIHYNLPGSLEAYYQEAGRAGRDGLPAECILYFAPADVMMQKFFIDKIGESNGQITEKKIAILQQRANKQLNAMQNYARWERCRRRQILEYFGEDKIPQDCHCDVCCAGKPALTLTGRAAAMDKERELAPRPALTTPRTVVVDDAEHVTYPAMLARTLCNLSENPASSQRNRHSQSGSPLISQPKRGPEPNALDPLEPAPPAAARLARLKEVRRDVVRSLGTMFFQHMPDELLRSLIEQPPKSLEGLRDDFEVHDKIIENFGKRILHLLSEGQDQPHVSQTRSNVGRPASPGYFLGVEEASGASPVRKKDRTSAAKVAAAMKVAGGKVGEVYGSEVEARFERLRTLRLELARARGWRAFRILHDTTLLEVARVRPRTVRELMKIKGIGEQKAADFGKELLAELARE